MPCALPFADHPTFAFIRVAWLMPPHTGMTPQVTQLTVATTAGHTATFTYGLSDNHGWDVRAQLDDRVVVRHCSSWSAVEHLYEWLRANAMRRSSV